MVRSACWGGETGKKRLEDKEKIVEVENIRKHKFIQPKRLISFASVWRNFHREGKVE